MSALIQILNDIALDMTDQSKSILDVNSKIEILWNEVEKHPNREKYIYSGKVYMSFTTDKKSIKIAEMVKDLDDFAIGVSDEITARAIGKVLSIHSDRKTSIIKRPSKLYIFEGITFCGLNVNSIISDNKDEDCIWNFMRESGNEGCLIFIRPESVGGLHLCK